MCKHFLNFRGKIKRVFLDFLWFFIIIYYENNKIGNYNFYKEKCIFKGAEL